MIHKNTKVIAWLLVMLSGAWWGLGCQISAFPAVESSTPTANLSPKQNILLTESPLSTPGWTTPTPLAEKTVYPVPTRTIHSTSTAILPTIDAAMPQLFYTKRLPDTGHDAIFSVLANGKEKTMYRDYASNPMWSSDGSLLAYWSQEDILGEWCIDNVYTHEQLICLDDSGDVVLSWHPEELKIIYTGNDGLVLFDVETMERKVLLDANNMPVGLITYLLWVDGEHFLMVSEDINGCHLYSLEAGDKSTVPFLQSDIAPCDSSLPAYVARFSVNSQNILAYSTSASQPNKTVVVLLDIDSRQELQQIEIANGQAFSPFWNPNNPNLLAFMYRNDSEKPQVQVIDIETKSKIADLRYYLDGSGFLYGFVSPWSKDGRYLAISTWKSNENLLVTYSLDKHRVWFLDSGDITGAAWKP